MKDHYSKSINTLELVSVPTDLRSLAILNLTNSIQLDLYTKGSKSRFTF